MTDVAPDIAAKNWWAVRAQFNRSVPPEATVKYLMVTLSLNETTARKLRRNLTRVGLLDESGRPTPLANRWRDDSQYVQACAEIAENVYSEELRQAAPGPDTDLAAAARWFQYDQTLGEGAAKNVARTYVLIASADLGQREEAIKETPSRANGAKADRGSAGQRRSSKVAREGRDEGGGTRPVVGMPSPQIAVQVNISPDMTPEQIESVFASMAKHFYGSVTARQ